MFITVSPMQESHLSAVAALERECFSHPWSEQSLAAESRAPGAHFFVACAEDTVVGYIGVTTVLDEASVTNVAVTASARRLGIGRKLLQTALAVCMQEKMAFLTLEVRASNAAAIALYRSEGFSEVGRRKNYYDAPTEDALLMTRFFPLND